MTAQQLASIRGLATEVREWAEKQAYRHPDYDEDLTGLCVRASGRLFVLLKMNGFESQIIFSKQRPTGTSGHVWVRCDGYIIDVTASQYKCDDISIIKIRKSMPWYWRESHVFNSTDDIIVWQIKAGWCETQQLKRKDIKCV